MENIKIVEELRGLHIVGYITKTLLENDSECDEVFYGVFTDKTEAISWGKKLINATVEPIYAPSYNRG